MTDSALATDHTPVAPAADPSAVTEAFGPSAESVTPAERSAPPPCTPAAAVGAPRDVVALFKAVLKKAQELGASDVHIAAGGPFRIRLRGQVVPVKGTPNLSPGDCDAIGAAMMIENRKATSESVVDFLRELNDYDCSYSLPGLGRFRVNIARQRGSLCATLRAIASHVPDIDSLSLPPVVKEIAMEDRGLVLVTGVTGSGKSTTLAAMLAHVNKSKQAKVVTIEDPIEFLHRDDRSIMVQRELGGDTESFARALRAALRQDPDIIMVGEMRDMETIDIAIKAAETGHLVFSTVHTTDAVKTISRLVGVFPSVEQQGLRTRLAESLRAVISQRLVRRKDGSGRIAAVEIMRTTAAIEELIADPGRGAEMRDLISEGRTQYGMQTFDQHLTEHYKSEIISLDEAMGAATSPSDFERNLAFT
jgi:twitching motility protein PilT